MVVRLYVGDLQAVGWVEGPWATVTPIEATRVGVGILKRGENAKDNSGWNSLCLVLYIASKVMGLFWICFWWLPNQFNKSVNMKKLRFKLIPQSHESPHILTSGQSYKQLMLVIYDSRVVIWGYFQVKYDSRVVNYDCRGFIRLATDTIPAPS